jgi:hypothetical protein
LSIKKYASVQDIFDELITRYGLKGYPALAGFLAVNYQTLMAWKKRGRIGDFAPFLDKCKGINLRCLETLEGELFGQQLISAESEPVYDEGLSNESKLAIGVIKGALLGLPDDLQLKVAQKFVDLAAQELRKSKEEKADQ